MYRHSDSELRVKYMNKSYIKEDYDLETVTNAKHVTEMLALIFVF